MLATRPQGRFEPLLGAISQVARNRGLRNLQLGSLAWMAADAAYLVGLLVLANAEGGSAAVAFVAVIRSLPSAVMTPLLINATRQIRRDALLRIVLVIRVLSVAAAVGLIVTAAPVGLLYLVAAIDSLAGAVLRPLRATLAPALATAPEELVAANVATSTGDSLAALLGPALAALLLIVSGVTMTFVAGLLALVVSLGLVIGVRTSQAPRTPSEKPAPAQPPGDRPQTTHLGHLRHAQVLIGLFVCQRFVRGMITVLIVPAAIEVLRIGHPGVGWLTAAVGFGGLVGGIVALALVGRRQLAGAFLVGLFAWGVGILASGAVPLTLIALIALSVAGIGKVVVDVAGVTLLQRTVPTAARGSMFGILEGLIAGALAAGSVVASMLVELIGPTSALVVAGGLPVIVGILAWPVLRSVDHAAVVPERELRLLRGVAMFLPLQLTTIEQLAEDLGRREAAVGEVVIRQGDPGDAFYIVEAGRLEAVVDGVRTVELGPGDSFGEIALVRDVPRTATVRAVEPSVLAILAREPFVGAITSSAESSAVAAGVIQARLGAG